MVHLLWNRVVVALFSELGLGLLVLFSEPEPLLFPVDAFLDLDLNSRAVFFEEDLGSSIHVLQV